ncbi:DUF2262 domain-containing protein [Brevundimonas sp.]|uniref:DUF2262 domain-containing protein n=1 Tax=Brevundimonas sp. TaxID=1871086 RepID=UPI00272FD88A|nr:DUF2262 domain-containing protein [Brevundimonas sp.]MDP1911968.1 DUF2262 domain-containing protein [Brevundimonas sp.]
MLDWFDKQKKQDRARRDRAQRQLAVEVTGIVPPYGAALVRMRDRPAEEVVTFYVWRVGEGPLEAGNLRLVQESIGDSPPFGSLRAFPPGSVIAAKARLARTDEGAFGVVAGPVKLVDPDKAFAEAIELQKTPPTFHDPHLGILTSDVLLGWVGEAKWLGKDCALSIDQLDDLAVAHALWGDQQRWTMNAINFATERLLVLKNNEWLGEEEEQISPTEFGDRLSLTSISIEAGGDFILDFDDGNLFWGHTITVEGSLPDGLTDAGLAG